MPTWPARAESLERRSRGDARPRGAPPAGPGELDAAASVYDELLPTLLGRMARIALGRVLVRRSDELAAARPPDLDRLEQVQARLLALGAARPVDCVLAVVPALVALGRADEAGARLRQTLAADADGSEDRERLLQAIGEGGARRRRSRGRSAGVRGSGGDRPRRAASRAGRPAVRAAGNCRAARRRGRGRRRRRGPRARRVAPRRCLRAGVAAHAGAARARPRGAAAKGARGCSIRCSKPPASTGGGCPRAPRATTVTTRTAPVVTSERSACPAVSLLVRVA